MADLRAFVKNRGGRRVLDQLFMSLDRDGSGYLSPEEIRLCLRTAVEQGAGTRMSKQDERVLCALMNIAAEGPMPQTHFEATMKTIREMVRAVNAANGSGDSHAEEKYIRELKAALASSTGRWAELEQSLLVLLPSNSDGWVRALTVDSRRSE